MSHPEQPETTIRRRGFLVRAIFAIHAAMGATMAFVLGGSILAPGFARREPSWLAAASVDALRNEEPTAVTVRVARRDGFTRVVDRVVVFLVKTDDNSVRALHSSCTHLGCRTSYDRQTKRTVCPCHGGVYDTHGNVLDGPPPAPLRSLATRVVNGQVQVQV